MDLPLNLSRSKVIAEKDRLFGFSDFGKRFVGRMRGVLGIATFVNRFGCRRYPF